MFYNRERLKHQMISNEIDIIIASTKENIRYFAGFEPVIKTLNPYKGLCFAVIDISNIEEVKIVHFVGEIDQLLETNIKPDNIYAYGTFYREDHHKNYLLAEEIKLKEFSKHPYIDAQDALYNLLENLKIGNKRIGIDEEGITYEFVKNLKMKFNNAKWTNGAEIIRSVRAIKTKQELELLQKASQIIENAINNVGINLYEGINEKEIVTLFNTSVVKQGGLPVLPMIKIGRHAIGGQRPPKEDITLQAGDTIWFDCDISFKGYWADIARVIAFKEIKPSIEEAYNKLLSAQIQTMIDIKEGMNSRDVFDLTLKNVKENGFSNYRRHHIGHGIGMEPYESPVLSSNDESLIENGMVLSIETPYYEYGLGALHIEDPVYVSDNGNIRLTKDVGKFRIVEGKYYDKKLHY